MNNETRYLIPANTKKGKLILGYFRGIDLMIFGITIGISLILLMIVGVTDTFMTILVLIPAFIGAFLVAPLPNYHNVLVGIQEIYLFFTNRQKYVWKGWCMNDGKANK